MGAKAEEFPIPLYRVSGGSYGEIGYAIGRAARERIRAAFAARREWVQKLLEFGEADPRARLQPFLKALRDVMPHLEEELQGIGEGAEVPFNQVLAAFLNPELSALMKQKPAPSDGCTTIGLSMPDKLWVGHNEDGSSAYREYMYLLDVEWPSGVRSWCFSYPGYLAGNGPSVNSRGMVQTVNFIGGALVRPGLPRYAIDRAIMEAKSLDEAAALATHPRRAYSQHHLIVSAAEKKMVSIETSADRHSIVEVSGIFTHANHLVHPEMEAVPQLALYRGSSLPRQMAADRWKAGVADPAALRPEDIMAVLSSHDGAPLSICRHPAAGLTGCTLGAAMIRAESEEILFYAHEPCRNISRVYEWP
ncbi:MAG TPA: C45 family peptidase [bacterium]|nr:C45 family peptidase [bacterium]